MFINTFSAYLPAVGKKDDSIKPTARRMANGKQDGRVQGDKPEIGLCRGLVDDFRMVPTRRQRRLPLVAPGLQPTR